MWQCALQRENEGAHKAPIGVVSKAEFAALARRPPLVQRLCTVYVQDFLCLGYPLPAECSGGGELGWLQGDAAEATQVRAF